MTKKTENTLSALSSQEPPVVKRRGHVKKTAPADDTAAVLQLEDKLLRTQKEYDKLEQNLSLLKHEYIGLLKKCSNIKLLLSSYYNMEEKTDQSQDFLVPKKKTTYWYIRATFASDFFTVTQCEWMGGMSDKFRYCRGNFFLDQQTANTVCDNCNAIMARLL